MHACTHVRWRSRRTGVRQVWIDGFEPAVVPEPQDDEVHGRDAPAVRDRWQPLEREVRIRLTCQEGLERAGSSELEGLPTRRNCQAGFGHTQPESRERESRRFRPQEDADRAPPAFGRTPKSRGNHRFSGQHRRRGGDGRPKTHERSGGGRQRLWTLPKLSDYNYLIPHMGRYCTSRSACALDVANYHQTLPPR